MLAVSAFITTLGFIMDRDIPTKSTLVQIAEFAGMTGLVFLFMSAVYFTTRFTIRTCRK